MKLCEAVTLAEMNGKTYVKWCSKDKFISYNKDGGFMTNILDGYKYRKSFSEETPLLVGNITDLRKFMLEEGWEEYTIGDTYNGTNL